MSVYVDPLMPCLQSRTWPYPEACHLYADSEAELDAFAASIFLRPEWKQKARGKLTHYDLTRKMRAIAMNNGAIPTDREHVVRYIQAARQTHGGNASCNKPTEYPIRNPGVATELRSRGLDVDVPHLQYCIRKGIFTPEGGGVRGSRYLWSAELIDQAAEHFASIGQFTPERHMCESLEIDFATYRKRLATNGGDRRLTVLQLLSEPAEGEHL